MNRSPFVLLVSLFFTMASVFAQAESPKIGVLSGLSGAAAKWNRYQNMGITLAQEELRTQGFPITLVFEDSKTEAPRAISAFNKLLDFDKVDAILANDFGFVIAPLLPLVQQKKVFMLAISLPHERYCNQARGYLFSGSSQFVLSRDAFDTFYAVHPNIKRIGIIAFDDPEWGNTYRSIWRELAGKHGATIVDEFVTGELTPDFKTALARMLPKEPEAIFIAHEPESFFKAARQLRYSGHVITANNVFEMLADGSNARPELDGVYVVDPVISSEFSQKFKKRFGLDPILEAYSGYEALHALAKAFQADPKNAAQGMRSVAYEGVAGPIDYTGQSCAGNQARWGLFQFQGSQLQPISMRSK